MKTIKKLLVLILAVFITSCSSIDIINKSSNARKASTFNGTYILSNKTNNITQFCDKTDLSTLTQNYKEQKIIDEFNNYDMKKYDYNTNPSIYKKELNYKERCGYDLYYYDYINKANHTTIGNIEIKNKETLNLATLYDRGIFDKFIQEEHNTVISMLVYNVMNNQKGASFINPEIEISKSGDYDIIATPVFRMLHFKDKQQIWDFDFVAVYGLSITLQPKGR